MKRRVYGNHSPSQLMKNFLDEKVDRALRSLPAVAGAMSFICGFAATFWHRARRRTRGCSSHQHKPVAAGTRLGNVLWRGWRLPLHFQNCRMSPPDLTRPLTFRPIFMERMWGGRMLSTRNASKVYTVLPPQKSLLSTRVFSSG